MVSIMPTASTVLMSWTPAKNSSIILRILALPSCYDMYPFLVNASIYFE